MQRNKDTGTSGCGRNWKIEPKWNLALVSCLKVFATETVNFLPGSQEPRQSGTAYMEYLVTFKQTEGDSFEKTFLEPDAHEQSG